MWRSTSTRNYRRKQRLRCLRAVLLRHSGSTVGGATMRRKSVKLERDEASPRMVAPHDTWLQFNVFNRAHCSVCAQG